MRYTCEDYIQSTTMLVNQMQQEQKMQEPFCLAEKEQRRRGRTPPSPLLLTQLTLR